MQRADFQATGLDVVAFPLWERLTPEMVSPFLKMLATIYPQEQTSCALGDSFNRYRRGGVGHGESA
jgi:hypothetical protein